MELNALLNIDSSNDCVVDSAQAATSNKAAAGTIIRDDDIVETRGGPELVRSKRACSRRRSAKGTRINTATLSKVHAITVSQFQINVSLCCSALTRNQFAANTRASQRVRFGQPRRKMFTHGSQRFAHLCFDRFDGYAELCCNFRVLESAFATQLKNFPATWRE